MTIQMNIAEAKGKLSELVTRAEAGEEVVLARNGKVVARIVPTTVTPKGPRQLGAWAHLGPLKDPDLFLRPDPETEAWLAEWENAPICPE
ncbi:MAG: hypothetical protein JWR84_3017 [Caulobacter sp.]|nr:hypothetical protein [Caulobacter sp.]